jgi:ATP-dependent DNA ligase
MKKFPTLFHKTSKGAINTWEVWSDGPFVYTKWGQLNGKMQKSCIEVTPKNAGRSNSTTVEQQAELEAQSLWTFKLERKYYQSQKEAENQMIFLPMLAQSFDKRKRFLTKEDYPAEIQPKLDGTRSLCHWDEDENVIKLISRSGKEYILPHIADELEPELPGNYVLDGELYVHGLPLQDLNTLVRRTKNMNPESVKVEYHVYDIIDQNNLEMTWRERYKLLEQFFSANKFVKIKLVNTETVYGHEEVYEMQSDFLMKGYEGAVVRLRDGKYKFGYRSNSLLKVKSFQDEEFEIIDFANGIGKFSNCIIYKCKTKEGKEFDVVPKGTFEQREQWLKEGKSHIGKMLKVQFADWTKDLKPQFPIGIAIRLQEDM